MQGHHLFHGVEVVAPLKLCAGCEVVCTDVIFHGVKVVAPLKRMAHERAWPSHIHRVGVSFSAEGEVRDPVGPGEVTRSGQHGEYGRKHQIRPAI